MFPIPSPVVLLGLMLCILSAHKTMAEQVSEGGVVYEAARNKIGLIRYCRKNELLDAAIADQAVTAVETGLQTLASSDISATEQGDRAQQAGEDGFWEAGRRRDIASVAKLFRTTPAELCKEWADETLRAQAPRRHKEITASASAVSPFLFFQRPQAPPPPSEPVEAEGPPTTASAMAVAPILLIEPSPQAEPTPSEPVLAETPPATAVAPILLFEHPPQAEPTPSEPVQAETPPARTTTVLRAARSASPPPLPEKAPFLLTEAEAASLQRTQQTGGEFASPGKTVSGHRKGTTAAKRNATPQSSKQAAPLSVRLTTEAAGRLPREQTVTAEVPPRRLDDQPPPLWGKWPFNRVGRSERCLMAGCKWPTPQERQSW